MTSFAVSSRRRVPFHASTCFLIGSKCRCMRSTPTERISTRLRCLVCLASTGVNTPGTMFPNSGFREYRDFLEADFGPIILGRAVFVPYPWLSRLAPSYWSSSRYQRSSHRASSSSAREGQGCLASAGRTDQRSRPWLDIQHIRAVRRTEIAMIASGTAWLPLSPPASSATNVDVAINDRQLVLGGQPEHCQPSQVGGTILEYSR